LLWLLRLGRRRSSTASSSALVTLGREDNKHLIAFHARTRFDLCDVQQILLKLFENTRAQLAVRHLAATKPDRRFDLVAACEPLARVLHTIIVIVIVRSRSELDLFDGDDDLFLLGLVRLLLGLVLELAKVNNAAHGRLGLRSDLDQIEPLLTRTADGVSGFQNAELFTIFIDHTHFRHADSFVDSRDRGATIVRALSATSKACSYFCTSRVVVSKTESQSQLFAFDSVPVTSLTNARDSTRERAVLINSSTVIFPMSPLLRSRTATLPSSIS
jgi:hypothetical protein